MIELGTELDVQDRLGALPEAEKSVVEFFVPGKFVEALDQLENDDQRELLFAEIANIFRALVGGSLSRDAWLLVLDLLDGFEAEMSMFHAQNFDTNKHLAFLAMRLRSACQDLRDHRFSPANVPAELLGVQGPFRRRLLSEIKRRGDIGIREENLSAYLDDPQYADALLFLKANDYVIEMQGKLIAAPHVRDFSLKLPTKLY